MCQHQHQPAPTVPVVAFPYSQDASISIILRQGASMSITVGQGASMSSTQRQSASISNTLRQGTSSFGRLGNGRLVVFQHKSLDPNFYFFIISFWNKIFLFFKIYKILAKGKGGGGLKKIYGKE